MKIKKKLTLAIGALLILYVILGSVAYYYTLKTQNNLLKIITAEEPASAAAFEMEINLIGTGFGVLGYMDSLDPLHLKRITKDEDDFAHFLSKYLELTPDQKGRELGSKIRTKFDSYKKLSTQLIQIADNLHEKITLINSNFTKMDEILDDKIQASIKDENNIQNFKKIKVSMEMEININGIAKGLEEYFISRSVKSLKRISKDQNDFLNAYKLYKKLLISPAEKEYSIQLYTIFNANTELISEVIKLVETKYSKLNKFVGLRRTMDNILDNGIQLMAYGNLKLAEQKSYKIIRQSSTAIIILIIVGLILGIIFSIVLSRAIALPIIKIQNSTLEISKGNLETTVDINSNDELGVLAVAFNKMCETLKAQTKINSERVWVSRGIENIGEILRSNKSIDELARQLCSCLAKILDIQIASMYKLENDKLVLVGSYAFNKRKKLNNIIEIGEGIVGQSVIEKEPLSITGVPEDYMRINSSLGDSVPTNIIIQPFIYNNEVVGAIELGSIKELSDMKFEFLKDISESIAITIISINDRTKLNSLLKSSQDLTNKLQTQQEELRSSNEELIN